MTETPFDRIPQERLRELERMARETHEELRGFDELQVFGGMLASLTLSAPAGITVQLGGEVAPWPSATPHALIEPVPTIGPDSEPHD